MHHFRRNRSEFDQHARRTLVIGAGVSGLIATKILQDDGFDVTCVDRLNRVGGCWNNAFDFVLLQSTRGEYHFPGLPYPENVPLRPGKQDTLRYWNNFVHQYDLASRVFLNISVVSLRQNEKNHLKWKVKFVGVDDPSSDQHGTDEVEFDFVVIATGLGYGRSSLAVMPEIDSCNFPGRVAHVSHLEPGELPDKHDRVLIVGFGPSAVAFAEKCAENAAEHGNVHLVVREPRWVIPQKVLGIIPYGSLLYSRAMAIMLPAFAHSNNLEKAIHLRVFRFFVRAFWWIFGLIVVLSARPPFSLIPRCEPFLEGMQSTISVLPQNLFKYCREGKIKVHVPAILSEMCSNGDIILSNGDVIHDVSLVLSCTGYKTDELRWISPKLKSSLIRGTQMRQLYRHIILPGEHSLAFLGFAGGFHGCLMEFVAANWISTLFLGELQLPSVAEMEADVDELVQWKMGGSGCKRFSPFAVGSRSLHFIDQLLQDMNISVHRKRSPFAWLFAKWTPDDYVNVPLERHALRQIK